MNDTGWHFVSDNLRDGQPVPADGEWLQHEGDIEICDSGLHYSRRIIDALTYAFGTTICRVEVEGAEYHGDKGVARRRQILWRVDGEALLRDFARRCALDVIHLWDAPDVVVRYLKTSDESLRVAARAAAEARATAEAWAAAWAATDARAAWDARDAAWAAAWAARDARDAAQEKQNRRLIEMVHAARVQ